MPERLSTEEARQGRTGKGVRYVLAVSLGLAVFALVIVFAVMM